jgi:DNA-binding transcriptional LysR family regulator
MTVPSVSAAAEVVAATDLVTMLPSSLLAAKGASLGLRRLLTPLPPHTTKFAMSWHERTHADPAARMFRTLVRSIVTQKRTKRA